MSPEARNETEGNVRASASVAEERRESLSSRVRRHLRSLFEIDPRSLGLFRICLGLTLVVDMAQQSAILEEMTTDLGSLPRDLHSQIYDPVERWSLHLLGGSWGFQAALCALTWVMIGAFIVGYRTRWVTLILWVLLVSLRNRHPLFDTASDGVRRLLLFWGLFLPLGCRFSLDKRAGRAFTSNGPLFSVATIAILLQLLMVYWGAGLPKDYETWVQKATATTLALRMDVHASRLGRALLDYPLILQATSIYTWCLETFGPLLLLIPFYRGPLRLIAIFAFISMHLGLALCMEIGAFPYLMMAAWLIYLPPMFWSWLTRLPDHPGFVGSLASTAQNLITRAQEILPVARVVSASPGQSHQGWVDGSIGQIIVTASLILVVVWNVQTTGRHLNPEFPRLIRSESVVKGMTILRLTQYWNVFAPHPPRKDAWLMVVATLNDGSKVDLFRGGAPVEWTKPEHVGDIFNNVRLRKYVDNLGVRRTGWRHYQPYAAMHVRRWNARNPESRHVKKVELIRMVEMTRPDLSERPVQTFGIWKGAF